MPAVTSDLLAGLMTNFRVIFTKELSEFDKTDGLYKKIVTIFKSLTDQETYAWLGSVPVMSEWKDVRKLYGIPAYDYTLINKHYEATLEVDRDMIEDDKYGMYGPRIRGLARRAVRYYNELVFSALDDNGDAYDGNAMFAASRTAIGASGTIVNQLSGSYSGSASEIRTALGEAIAGMRLFKDDRGKPMNLVPDTIVCAPAMEILMRTALLPGIAGVQRVEAGYFGTDQIISSPWIDADTLDWYVLCTKAEVSPIILQDRKQPEFVPLDDPKGEHVFKQRTFLYGVDMRCQIGYGDPRTAIKIVDSG